MKALRYFYLLMMPFIILAAHAATPQDTIVDNYITINGIVKDKENKKAIPYATISLSGSSISTVSNADGEFVFKIKQPVDNYKIEISHIGYRNAYISPTQEAVMHIVWLTPLENRLDEVVVHGHEPRSLVEEAIMKIKNNYSTQPHLLTGFYRESARKRKRYINIAEAVIHMDKSSYTNNAVADRVQILKGRQLVSPKKSDTLSVKLLGGPTTATYLDIVKNPDLLISPEILPFYDFHMEEATTINERPHYVVSFLPNRELPFALYYGKLYIDKERLSFTSAEFYLDLSNRTKAIQTILHKKPKGLRFKPIEVAYRVNYAEYEGKIHLSYVSFRINFTCDWRRKLFSTNYTILSEMVVTDIQPSTQRILSKDAFSKTKVLSDNVAPFFDKDFWGSYNIIKPDESLETAVDKLKKKIKQ